MPRPAFLAATLLTLSASIAHAQSASRYLPMGDWRMDYIEHLIRARVIADPDPMTRPLRVVDVLTALRRADTATASASVRATVQRITDGLDSLESEPIYRSDMWLGPELESQARRDPVRDAGSSFFSMSGGMQLSATFGPFVASSGPFWDRRLRYDPDYTGNRTQRIPGRWNDSYLSIQSKYADVTFGQMDRNWGPPGIEGLMVSNAPYSYDALILRVGTPVIRFESLITRLDDDTTTALSLRRWWIVQRAWVHPFPKFVFAFGQGTLLVGGDRSIEPWWLNPFKISQFTQTDELVADSGNTLVTGDFRYELPNRWILHASVLVDDFSFDALTAPNRIGATGIIDAPVSPDVSVRLAYQMASSLTYRSQQGPAFAVMRHGIGLGRNFDDYDQTTLSATVLPYPGVLLTPEVTLLRQGEGTIHTPFTLPDTSPFLFIGVVERTWRLALSTRAQVLGALDVNAHAGMHFTENFGHVPGASDSRFVGGISLRYRFGGRVRIDL